MRYYYRDKRLIDYDNYSIYGEVRLFVQVLRGPPLILPLFYF